MPHLKSNSLKLILSLLAQGHQLLIGKFTKYVSILKIGTYSFLCQCSKIPLKQMAKAWGGISNPYQIPEKKANSQTTKNYLCSSVFIKRRNLLTKGNTIQCSCSNPQLPAGFGSPIYYIHITKCKPCVLIVKLSPYIHVIKWRK